ncbi:hypothetical protein [Actinomyces wuliandei]|uniref:hypothetical protein n=1 Tax=Actinomyces wuliandei TaxID=2057743 RepID=UPI000FD7DA1B|nr:hypothetical protein [Actinomyces wuliandei]
MLEFVDLVSLWGDFVTTAESVAGADGLFTVLARTGTIPLVLAVGSWALQRRRGGQVIKGRRSTVTLGALIAALTLAAPRVVIPVALLMLQTLVNLVIALFNLTGSGG